MNAKLEGISTVGLITPRNCYIFLDFADRGLDPDSLDLLYAIQKEEEILPALDLEMRTWAAESYELITFLGISKISNDCHEFKMFVYDKEEEIDREFSLYLHRITTFEEKLQWVKKLYLESSASDSLRTAE